MWVLGIKLRSSCFLIHRDFLYPLSICVIHQGERRSDESLTFKELAGSGDKTSMKLLVLVYGLLGFLKILLCINVLPACICVHQMHTCLIPWNWVYKCLSHHVGARNRTWVLCKSNKCS